MNQHLSNVLRQDPCSKDYPNSFEICLKNPLRGEYCAWDIAHSDMNDFLKSMPSALWEENWVGTNTFLRSRMRNRPSVGIANIDREWTAWLPLDADTRFRIEEHFSKKSHLIKQDR